MNPEEKYKMHFRSWWGIKTNKQKNDLRKKYFENTNKCTIVKNDGSGIVKYLIIASDENLITIAKGEKANCRYTN